MKIKWNAVGLVCALIVTGSAQGAELEGAVKESVIGLEPVATNAPVVFMIGDSTMANKPLEPAQPERGWGQLLPLYFRDGVRVVNLAVNGRSSKSFRDEGRWEPVVKNLRKGDFVIIQFGHNDEKANDPKRYSAPFDAFTKNLERYVQETREHGGNPVLATPVARRTWTNGTELADTHGDYVVAVRQVAAEQKVPLLDLNRDSSELLKQLGPDLSKKLFMWVAAGEFRSVKEAKEDNTHFNAYGACRICDLAVSEIRAGVPELAEWLKRGKGDRK
jgi:lysophospholipase L1-like esterase